MARYLKLAPLVFFLCACLLLLVVGCAKAPADQVKEGQAVLSTDPAKALEHAQAAIDKLGTAPAGPERDKTLFDARVLKIEALGFTNQDQAMREFEALSKDSPGQVTGQLVWQMASALNEGSGSGQGAAVALLDEGKKRFPDRASQFDGLITSIQANPSASGKSALSKLGYIGASKKDEPKADAKSKDEGTKPKE
jgi:hypothetical protein